MVYGKKSIKLFKMKSVFILLLIVSFVGGGFAIFKREQKIQLNSSLEDMKLILLNIRRHCATFPTTEEGFPAIKDPDGFYGLRCKDFPRDLLKLYSDKDINGEKLIYVSDGKVFYLRSSTGAEVRNK